MEFVPVEVYANDSPGRDKVAASRSERDEKPLTHGNNGEEARSDLPEEPASKPYGSRLPDVLSPEYLPPIAEKASAFECFRVVADKAVFAGRSDDPHFSECLMQHDGVILQWKVQQTSSVTPLNVSLLRGHTGAVLALEFSTSLGKEGLLFSGAADRSIKVWDPWRGSEAEQQLHGDRNDHFCVQTLPAHQASVTCLRLLTHHQRPGLVSASLDHTIKVWYQAEGRGLLMYPWFVAAQTIAMSSTSCWATSLCIRDAAMSCSLFVGDSEGNVSHYTSGLSLNDDQPADMSTVASKTTIHSTSRIQFKLKRKHSQFHSLGVLQLQLICESNFVVSLGFDHKVHILDAMSGCVSSTITNRNATRFTSCAWDARGGQWLFLADAMGYVHVWNVFEDKWVKKEKVVPRGTPLLHIHLHPTNDWLFTGVANMMKQWKIKRDVGYGECTGHSDAIVGFAVLRDEVLVESSHNQSQLSSTMATSSRFFSVSLDNTLRCWDAFDMKAAFGFEERQSEITCVATSKRFSKIVTGHEGGFLKAWSIHTGQYMAASLPSKSAVTCLTTGMVRDQEFIFASDVDGNLFLWELHADCLSFSGAAHVELSNDTTRREEISAVFFCKGDYINLNGGSEFLVIGYQSGFLALWSFHKKLVLKAWKAHDDAVSSICRHGCFVLTGSDDTTVRIWNFFNLTDPYELGVLRSPGERSSSGYGASIVAVDVIPESGSILCASADGTVSVWDYTDYDDKDCTDFDSYGKLVYRTQHNHQLRCMQYWPSRQAVLCGSSEGRILVLSLPPQLFNHPWSSSSELPHFSPGPMRISIVGDAFVDVVAGTIAPDQLPKWGGDTEVARPIELQPGGSALNTATHLAALAPGDSVTLHTVVGADAFGDVLRAHLASRGVALSSPSLDGVPTGVCIVLSGTEDRSFITHYGAARAFSIEHIDQDRLLDTDHLHIGGFYSCTNLRSNLKPLLEAARAKGITTSLDTNYDSTEKWEGLEELLPLLDVFMPNEVEAMAVAKTDSVDAAMAYLRARVGGLTLIKIGAGGARAYCAKTQQTFHQASYKTSVVDVTGAGDSFNSGFLAAWKSSGGDVQKGLQWGCATASKCVAAMGACSATITAHDVQAVVAKGDTN